jgi:hypothetical protein
LAGRSFLLHFGTGFLQRERRAITVASYWIYSVSIKGIQSRRLFQTDIIFTVSQINYFLPSNSCLPTKTLKMSKSGQSVCKWGLKRRGLFHLSSLLTTFRCNISKLRFYSLHWNLHIFGILDSKTKIINVKKFSNIELQTCPKMRKVQL